MGPVKGLQPAIRPPMVYFNGFQQSTPLLVIILLLLLHSPLVLQLNTGLGLVDMIPTRDKYEVPLVQQTIIYP
jgi:hypothetical protein